MRLHRSLLSLSLFLAVLSGCSTGANSSLPPTPPSPPVPTGPVAGVAFSGKVIGNGVPLTGASVQLYEAGTSGNGSPAAALLSSELTTDDTGSFIVPSTFSCAATNSVLYLIAKGGQTGNSRGNNASLWFMAPVGLCGSLSASTTVTLDELTTVASAFAFAPFLSSGGNLGASATNALGLTNAVITAQTLANMSTGLSPGANIPSNVTVETDKLNALANALVPCTATANCAALFLAAAPASGASPANTLDAALNIVRQPATNVAEIYALTANTLYQPSLTSEPSDWTLAITLTGGGLNEPADVAIDGFGKIWAVSYNGALSAFAPGGAPVFPSGITGHGIYEAYGMAIDANNNVWTANDQTPGINNNNGSVSEFTNAGQPLSGPLGYTEGNLNYPLALAPDTNGTMWVANYGGYSVTQLTSTGAPVPGVCNELSCTSSSLEFPDAIAVDANHFAWVASQASSIVDKISPDGTQITPIGCCYGATSLAIDSSGNVWSANYPANSISLIANSGAVISDGYTGGGLSQPRGIAVDGAGAVWVTNFHGASFSGFTGSETATPGTAFSPVIGFGTDANLILPYGIAVDASGGLWISSFGDPGKQGTLTEFVGLATPVKTPLVGPVQIP